MADAFIKTIKDKDENTIYPQTVASAVLGLYSGSQENIQTILDYKVNRSELDGYLPLTGGRMTGSIKVPNGYGNHGIVSLQDPTSNYTLLAEWLIGGTGWTDDSGVLYKYQPEIGQHNTGNGTGTIAILPYATNENPWGGNVGLFIGNNLLKLDGKVVLTESNAGNYVLPLSGGTMSGQIKKNGVASSWIKGRDNAMIKMQTVSGYSPIASLKTTNGSWEIGTYNNNSFLDDLVFSYASDSNYSADTNNTTRITFFENGTIGASITGNAATATSATTATKLATARTISLTGSVTGSGTFDGSGNLSISTSTNHSHSYLPLSGGTMTGQISFATIATWPTASGETYPINSQGLYWSGSSDWAKIFYSVTGSDVGKLVLDVGDDANAEISFRNCGVEYAHMTRNGIYGAVWNDYAEFRQADTIEPGRVVIENGDDTLSLSTERLQGGAEVISDTFGFAIGETEKCKTPIAATGRVLAYPYEDRSSYRPGDAVCSGPNGTISKMTDEEIQKYPHKIIGTVSAIPDYEEWGTGNVKVNGRIWIRIR